MMHWASLSRGSWLRSRAFGQKADSAASAALRRRLNLTAEVKVGGMETAAACWSAAVSAASLCSCCILLRVVFQKRKEQMLNMT